MKDIHFSKCTEQQFNLSKKVYYNLSKPRQLKQRLKTILDEIRKLTKIQCISIRLHDHGDYPYFTYEGFDSDFILQENSLCVKDEEGLRLCEPDGSYLLECMCGNIIRERFDPDLDFFTEQGSFISNNTTQLLATTDDEDRQSHTRNYCNSCGFESVALIPLKYHDTNIGLLQLNDSRPNMFTSDLIRFLEFIAEVLAQKIVSEPSFEHPLYESTKNVFISICMFCKKIRQENNWIDVESFLTQIENTKKIKFSHGICPKCLDKEYSEYSKDLD